MKRTGKSLLKIRRFFRILGPGVITGASDDDPSGFITLLAMSAAAVGLLYFIFTN